MKAILIIVVAFVMLIEVCGKSTGQKLNNTTENEKTFTGTFKSTKGVMKPISCYCYNSGFLTTSDNQEIAVCFDNENIDITCESITIKGYFKKLINNPEPTSPCPKGEMEIFMVTAYECN